jgi:hypothetical protein
MQFVRLTQEISRTVNMVCEALRLVISGLKPKGIFFERNGLKNLTTENLVAGLHVGHLHIGQGVEK